MATTTPSVRKALRYPDKNCLPLDIDRLPVSFMGAKQFRLRIGLPRESLRMAVTFPRPFHRAYLAAHELIEVNSRHLALREFVWGPDHHWQPGGNNDGKLTDSFNCLIAQRAQRHREGVGTDDRLQFGELPWSAWHPDGPNGNRAGSNACAPSSRRLLASADVTGSM
jgi:hypothetical protein